MVLKFVSALSVETSSSDATAWHKALPRPLRKTLRLHPARQRQTNTHDGVDSYMKTSYRDEAYRTDTYHTQNLEYLDRGYDFDEFGDIDNEYEGLTITEPMDEVESFNYLTGYDIL